jgi:hypothetical protein
MRPMRLAPRRCFSPLFGSILMVSFVRYLLLLLFAVAAVVVAVVLKTGGTYFYRSYSSIYRSIFAIIVAYMDLVTLLSFIYMYIKLFVGGYFRDMLGLCWAIIG